MGSDTQRTGSRPRRLSRREHLVCRRTIHDRQWFPAQSHRRIRYSNRRSEAIRCRWRERTDLRRDRIGVHGVLRGAVQFGKWDSTARRGGSGVGSHGVDSTVGAGTRWRAGFCPRSGARRVAGRHRRQLHHPQRKRPSRLRDGGRRYEHRCLSLLDNRSVHPECRGQRGDLQPGLDRNPRVRYGLFVRRRRCARRGVQSQLVRGAHVDRGLPRRLLLHRRRSRRRLCRRTSAQLWKHRRFPTDRTMDVVPRARVFTRSARGRGARQLRRKAPADAPPLLPEHEHGQLHGPVPGPVERGGELAVCGLRGRVHDGKWPGPARHGALRRLRYRARQRRPASGRIGLDIVYRSTRNRGSTAFLARESRPRQ